MAFKVALLCLAALLGGNAAPIDEEQDMSIFFFHTDPNARITIRATLPALRATLPALLPPTGGSNAGNVPFMVALVTGTATRSFMCGGSIVNERHVLTAAHCMMPVGGNNPNASLRGVVGTNRWNSGGVAHAFQRGIMHPNYNPANIKNDIGILVTSGNIALSAAVQTLAINFDFIGGGVATRVTGWGNTATGGPLSPTLLELRPAVVDGARCVTEVRNRSQQLNIRAPSVDPAVEICTFLAANRGTCNGDSGSPLVHSDRNQQIGIVSWGLPCARGASEMFVRVSAFRTWIQNNTRLIN